jgi:hypothetical protein
MTRIFIHKGRHSLVDKRAFGTTFWQRGFPVDCIASNASCGRTASGHVHAGADCRRIPASEPPCRTTSAIAPSKLWLCVRDQHQ